VAPNWKKNPKKNPQNLETFHAKAMQAHSSGISCAQTCALASLFKRGANVKEKEDKCE